MRTSQAEHVHSSTNQATAATDPSLDWTRMARVDVAGHGCQLVVSGMQMPCLDDHIPTPTKAAVAQAPSQPPDAADVPGPMAANQTTFGWFA